MLIPLSPSGYPSEKKACAHFGSNTLRNYKLNLITEGGKASNLKCFDDDDVLNCSVLLERKKNSNPASYFVVQWCQKAHHKASFAGDKKKTV